MGKKTNTENEVSKAYQSHTGSIDSNCMNRINALNSKINEKISLLINTYEKWTFRFFDNKVTISSIS